MSKKVLTVGGVGQVKGRIKGMGPVVLSIRNDLDEKMKDADWLASAPFESISGEQGSGLAPCFRKQNARGYLILVFRFNSRR